MGTVSEESHATDVIPTVDDFLSNLQPADRKAFLSLRAMVVSLGGDVKERVHVTDVTYSRMRPFLVARHHHGHLNVAFPEGNTLQDPLGRLLHKGNERHLRLDNPDALDGHVQEFVRSAYTQARG